MRIGELARRTGVAASRIRFYEKHALVARAARDKSGYRDYPDAAVKTLRLIDGAQQLGFSLTEIREGLLEAAPHFPSHEALANALRRKLKAVDQHIGEARARRRQILELLNELESGDVGQDDC